MSAFSYLVIGFGIFFCVWFAIRRLERPTCKAIDDAFDEAYGDVPHVPKKPKRRPF